ncbi:uncharacterized protein [Spinacia oleracea]|uniref:Uncharacterized protein isoform X2 n=1 Tax=Spinacia oleracea TaxID=3562 RepID=A0ABM3QVE4_SPIOL|nr:uncharacterized protein LOC110784334 isoform X2 [Spinacia oleracea]
MDKLVQAAVQKTEEENFDLSDSEYFGVWVDDSVEPFLVVPETPMDDVSDPETPIDDVNNPESPMADLYDPMVVPDTPDRGIAMTLSFSRKRKGNGDKVESSKRGKVSNDDVFEMLKGYVPSLERHMMGDSSDSE